MKTTFTVANMSGAQSAKQFQSDCLFVLQRWIENREARQPGALTVKESRALGSEITVLKDFKQWLAEVEIEGAQP